jgi:hypothetical protein
MTLYLDGKLHDTTPGYIPFSRRSVPLRIQPHALDKRGGGPEVYLEGRKRPHAGMVDPALSVKVKHT